MEMKKWSPNIMKNSDMERLSIVDDDYDLESPNLDKQSKYNPVKLFRKCWIYYPKSACGILALLAILPFAISIYILSTKNTDNGLSNDTTDCDTSDAWAKSFSVQSYGHGIVAADDARCSQIGADILSLGGNAMDAAISVVLCLGVVSPASSGLGGGCFILGYNASTKESIFVDSRETAPAGASQNMYVGKPKASVYGGLAVAIPGELKGLYLAWQTQGGGVSWEQIVSPSVELAKNWKISPTVARYITKVEAVVKSNPTLYSTLLRMYFHPDNTPKKSGEYVQNIALSNTLAGIAKLGPDYLYGNNSPASISMAQEIQAAGGIITADEITSYTPTMRDAIEMEVFGYRYFGSPPPSSGGVIVGAILQFLSHYIEPIASQQGLYYHHLAEAMKHTFAIRMSLGDPDYVNVTKVVNDLVNGELIQSLQEITREDHILDSIDRYGGPDYGVKYTPEDHGTSHISVLDKDGNAVAITSTINTYFGSLIMSPSTGIVFNNEMDDFSSPNASNYFGLAPFPSNYIEPGKKPLSSMSPSILIRKSDNRVRLVGGASGGPRIITATAQVLLNFLAKGMSLLDAVIEPRIHSQLFPQTVYLEDVTLDCADCLTLDQNGDPIPGRYQQISSASNSVIVNALKSRGHNITVDTGANFGVCQFIDIEYEQNSLMTAVSDPRKGGKPAAAT